MYVCNFSRAEPFRGIATAPERALLENFYYSLYLSHNRCLAMT